MVRWRPGRSGFIAVSAPNESIAFRPGIGARGSPCHLAGRLFAREPRRCAVAVECHCSCSGVASIRKFLEGRSQHGKGLCLGLCDRHCRGCCIGFVLGFSRFATEVADPILGTIYSIPKITLYPIILLVFGLTLSAKVAFGVLHGIFPVIIATMAALRNVAPVIGVPRAYCACPGLRPSRRFWPRPRFLKSSQVFVSGSLLRCLERCSRNCSPPHRVSGLPLFARWKFTTLSTFSRWRC